MSKIKKVLALVLTMAMVMAMSIVSFAATKDNATITVSNAAGATLNYAQVIKPDQTTRTGWAFVNEAVASAYMNAFSVSNDPQLAIEAMIPAANVDASKLSVAQANAVNYVSFSTMDNPQTVTSAGVYLITAAESGYTYNVMSAYVGFGEVVIDEENTYEYPSLTDASVEAKKTPIGVNKSVADTDNVVKTGDVLTYTVTTNVPYINPTDNDKTFFVYDVLDGAVYTEKEDTTITLAGTEQDAYTVNYNADNTGFSVDLSGMINDANSNAGKAVVITYKVKVTSENDTITNTATAGHQDGSDFGSKTTTTYEGNIVLTKCGENENIKLADAEFEVRLNDKTSSALTFVKLSNGAYKYDPEGTITTLVTNSNGEIKVQGLGLGTYYFKETKAPKGYSVNERDAEATLELADGTTAATSVITATTSMADTKLSALPSTGGIGTMIFTVVGCLIMIAAAAMFFVSRRRTEK